MDTNLYTVFQHFVTNSKYIKELFRATTRNFSDLQVFDPTLSQVATFSIEDQRSILSLVCGSPALVVLGQNSIKAHVVNKILNEPLLMEPMLDNEVWRMVKIKFSKNRFMTHLTKEGLVAPFYLYILHLCVESDVVLENNFCITSTLTSL